MDADLLVFPETADYNTAQDKLLEHFKVPPSILQLAINQLVQLHLLVIDPERGPSWSRWCL